MDDVIGIPADGSHYSTERLLVAVTAKHHNVPTPARIKQTADQKNISVNNTRYTGNQLCKCFMI